MAGTNALRQPNCEFTDGRHRNGSRQTASLGQDGAEHDFDIIVFATGFKVFQNAARLNITGRGGRKLEQDWAEDDPKAHLGITAPGFPNLFFMQGPNTVLAHGGSAIFTSECQARYAVGAIRHDAGTGHCSARRAPGGFRTPTWLVSMPNIASWSGIIPA